MPGKVQKFSGKTFDRRGEKLRYAIRQRGKDVDKKSSTQADMPKDTAPSDKKSRV